MAKVWYCANCGYEVHSRGRCHACRQKLTPSALPELVAGSEDEEVGYRLEGWGESDRGRLIVKLNDMGIPHRFEEEELVVDASDEERVDDLISMLSEGLVPDDGGEAEASPADEWALDDLDGSAGTVADDLDDEELPPGVAEAIDLLVSAATRLREDPTDMQADADVAEASTAVFLIDRYGPLDEDAWSAVGRSTRRLLGLLGAEEALEDGIRREAAMLEKLLAPLSGTQVDHPFEGEKTEYDLSDWTAEQRAELGVSLEGAGISYEWEGDDLLVPAEREAEVEDLFGGISGVADDDLGDEARYQAVTELFASSGRLAADPDDEERQDAVVEWFLRCEGPPLLGMDEVDWFHIMARARSLVAALEPAGGEEEDAPPEEGEQAGDGQGDDVVTAWADHASGHGAKLDLDLIRQEAAALHDLLRNIV